MFILSLVCLHLTNALIAAFFRASMSHFIRSIKSYDKIHILYIGEKMTRYVKKKEKKIERNFVREFFDNSEYIHVTRGELFPL